MRRVMPEDRMAAAKARFSEAAKAALRGDPDAPAKVMQAQEEVELAPAALRNANEVDRKRDAR
jgi:hypothetical protein